MKDRKSVLTRRDFIRGTIGAAIGASISGLKWPVAEAKTTRSSLVTVVRDKNAMDSSKNVNSGTLEKNDRADFGQVYRSEQYNRGMVKSCQAG